MRHAVAAIVALLISLPPVAREQEMPRTIQDVKARHADRLLTVAGVVSVGIGLDADGHEVIVIGLDRPRPETQANLPAQLEGYPVRVDVIGTVRAQ